MGTEKTEADPAQEVRKNSDALLDAIRALHELEREKRAQQLSTPEFHAMAREITERSREEVFRLAAEEERAGDEVESQQEETTEDIRP